MESTSQKLKNLILAIDPGKSSGLALLSTNGDLQWAWNYTEDDLLNYLKNLPTGLILHVVMENFITYRHKASKMTGSKQEAAKTIGMVQTWAKLNDLPVTMQMANVIPIAERWSKVKPIGDHSKTHWTYAYNHGFYWLVTNRYTEARSAPAPSTQIESAESR